MMAERNESIHDLIDALLRAHPPGEILVLDTGGVVTEIRSNEPMLMEKLRRYFRPFVITSAGEPDLRITALEAEPPDLDLDFTIKTPDPGKMKIKEEYIDLCDGRIVRKRLTGMVFFFGRNRNLALGPCTANDNQVVNFVNNRYLERQLNRGWILGHAAGVSLNGRGLALAGFSGAGKSTLALHLMSRGTAFVSNDRLLIKKHGNGLEMRGVAKLPRVNPGTLLNNRLLAGSLTPEERSRFSRMNEEELWTLEEKHDVLIDRIFGEGKFRLASPLDGLVILSWKRGGAPFSVTEVDPGDRRDLLPAFIKSPGLFYEPDEVDPERAFSEAAYIDSLRSCRVYEISGGVDFDLAAEACLDIMNSESLKHP